MRDKQIITWHFFCPLYQSRPLSARVDKSGDNQMPCNNLLFVLITLNNLRYYKVPSLVDVVKILKILPYVGMAAIYCRDSFNIFVKG